MLVECGFETEKNGSDILVDVGPAIQVVISFDPSASPSHGQQRDTRPQLMEIQALVDTGAKESHIDSVVAKVLNLPVIDKRTIAGSNGKHAVDVYLARIHVPELNETIFGGFAGVKLVEGGSKHGAILGRAFLKNIKMNYNGITGRVTLTKS